MFAIRPVDENHLVQGQKHGAPSKNRKTLKISGSGPENANAISVKGGKSSFAPSSSKQKPRRRALGDISNKGKGLGGSSKNKPLGKSSEISFSIPTQPKPPASKPITAPVRKVAPPEVHVEEPEEAMGRLGEEEEVLVEKKLTERISLPFDDLDHPDFFSNDIIGCGSAQGLGLEEGSKEGVGSNVGTDVHLKKLDLEMKRDLEWMRLADVDALTVSRLGEGDGDSYFDDLQVLEGDKCSLDPLSPLLYEDILSQDLYDIDLNFN